MPLRVLVADDSALFRRVITEALASIRDVEIVGSAANGRLAVQMVRELQPDLLTLDIEMPGMDGLAVLDALRQAGEDTMVIVVSALTSRGGRLTMQALEKGALDFITKPDSSGAAQSRAAIVKELAQRLPALANRLAIRKILKNAQQPPPSPVDRGARKAADLGQAAEAMNRMATTKRPEMVLIGVSTGGPNALAQLLPAIPKNIGVPFLVVQHMPPIFTQSLAESLSAKCALQVREASHSEPVVPNTVYIAPGGKQMRVASRAGDSMSIEITDDPPENNCKPSVDYLFRSVALRFPGPAMAVILTGMGSDGTLGLRLLKRNGCHILAQDEASCVVFGMPKAAIDAGVVDAVLPIEAMAAKIVSSVRGG
ncbi:MAG TPA: chemotaxis response regulator protein-glutamate methylesterase [Syntrophobacteraceae bacterium]|nr:chemotaxis response regulator protein-glutamate methylesterase [Syntrophobacteraceae bacterium]